MVIVRPLDDHLVVRPVEAAAMKGSLVIPEVARERPQQGVVLGAGPTVDVKQLRVGDVVLYGRYAGSVVDVQDEDLVILRQGDVLAVLEDEGLGGPAPEVAESLRI